MSKRKQKKYEKEIRDRRAAEEKVKREDERRDAEKERRASLTPEQRKSEDSTNAKAAFGCFTFIVIIALIFFVACRPDGDDDNHESSGSRSSYSAPADGIAGGSASGVDAERWLKDNLGVSSFTEILTSDPTLWGGYVNGVELDGGQLHVRLQVDRDSDSEMAKRASDAIANLVRFSDDHRVSGVDWVIVEDGAGTYMSQTKV